MRGFAGLTIGTPSQRLPAAGRGENIPDLDWFPAPCGLASGIDAQIAATIPKIRNAKIERRDLSNKSSIFIASLPF
jgi:hypothetical protein